MDIKNPHCNANDKTVRVQLELEIKREEIKCVMPDILDLSSRPNDIYF